MSGGRGRQRLTRRAGRQAGTQPDAGGRAGSTPEGARRGAEALRRTGNAAAGVLLERLGPGQPLRPGRRTRLERVFGEDFSGVRVVEGPDAARAADAVDAAGFATGDTVVLGHASVGMSRQALLAHELAHVVQQRRAGVVDAIGGPEDAAERRADVAGRRAAAGRVASPVPAPGPAAALSAPSPPVPAVQRQVRKGVLTRAQAQQRIARYLEGQLRKQGGQTIAVTPEVKNMLRRILLNDFSRMLKLDAYLGRTLFPGNPADLAAEVARFLPDYIEEPRLAHLEASTGPSATTFERVKGALARTAPFESAEQQESRWAFDRMAKEARKGEATIGPYALPLQRIVDVGKELSKPTPPPRAARARTYASVEKVIATLDEDALVPAGAKGTPAAGDYADARELARSIAGDLDIAQQRRDNAVAVRLGPSYAGVKDKARLAAAVAEIVVKVRNALPHRASEVATVEIYFGDRIVRQVAFGTPVR